MKYKAVVFDLDGTLLNTLEDLADSLNRVLQAKGLPTHALEAFRYFVGSGAAKLVSRALPPEARNDELCADCLAAFRKEYQQNWNRKTRPYKGVAELLDGLTAQGIAMAVLTNKPQHFAELCIREFLSDWRFTMILGQRDGVPMKPDPAGSQEILRRLDIPAQACLYVGDSDVDMTTGPNANMLPVGVTWGFRSEEELREAGAAKVIHHPTDLLALVE